MYGIYLIWNIKMRNFIYRAISIAVNLLISYLEKILPSAKGITQLPMRA